MKIGFVFAENIKWWAILSPFIMRVQGTDFSHCAIVVSDANRSTVFHSEWPIGYCVDMKEWSKAYKIKHYFMFDVPDVLAVNMMHWLCNQVRKPYSIGQLILILIYNKSEFMKPLVSNVVLNGDCADICSEFVSSFIEEFFTVDIEKRDDLIDLRDVFDAVKKIKGV